MIVLIIGLSLSFIAIGILYYLNNQLKKSLKLNNKALLALQKEFTQYQIDESRTWEKMIAKEEIRHDNIAKCIKKNEDTIYSINKTFYLDANKLFNKFEKFGFYVIDQPIKIKLLNNIFFRFLRNRFVSIEFLAIKK